MKLLRWLFTLVFALSLGALVGCSDDDVTNPAGPDPAVPAGKNVVIQWNNAALQAIRDTKPGPPMTARALAIVHTCIYDAWAAYDDVAVGTRFGNEIRRPENERTEGRKAKAMSFAAYRALSDLYPTEVGKFKTLMTTMGYDPEDASRDHETPAGIGNVCAAAVIAFRHVDGSNQLGDLAAGAYGDYTGYLPTNPAIAVDTPTPLAQIPHPDRWQPLTYVNLAGATVTPKFIAPQWGNVVPFAMTSASQFRPVPPAPFGSAAFRTQCEEVVQLSAGLTDEQKVIAEYWADGPSSELPPGHFDLFAQFVSERDRHTLDQDARLFFALTNAVFDAGIAVWEAKRFYDYARPVTAIRSLFNGEVIRAWAGPGLGTREISGAAWKPYQPSYFPTPPFPEYPSGHSGFSAAAAEVLRRFTGSDNLGFSFTYPAGSTKAEPGVAPATNVTITVATFTEAADQAGISRRYGGIHFKDGDLASRTMGRQCGATAWNKAEALWSGLGQPFKPVGETLP